MKVIKVTYEYRFETEREIEIALDDWKRDANEKGYAIGAVSYTRKDKKAKGEIIDSGYLVKVVRIYDDFWSKEEE